MLPGYFWPSIAFLFLVSVISALMMPLFSKGNQFLTDGRTIIVTGGSQGMGKSVAILLAKKGANVCIVARNIPKLKVALQEISAAALRPSQRFHLISADLTSHTSAARVIAETTSWNRNTSPDVLWCCAGIAYPHLFIDTPVEKLPEQMDSNYFSSAYIAHALLRTWLPPSSLPSSSTNCQTPSRHIIFTSSVVAFYPIAGYSSYSPAKSALRALSDTLSQELQIYPHTLSPPIRTHTIFPATILGTAYDEEKKVKHPITTILEEGDGGQSADEVARMSVQGLERGEEMVTTSWLGYAMYCGMMGGSRKGGLGVMDTVVGWVVIMVMLFVRWDMDRKVRRWGRENLGTRKLKG